LAEQEFNRHFLQYAVENSDEHSLGKVEHVDAAEDLLFEDVAEVGT
jgi:hypothetical protein